MLQNHDPKGAPTTWDMILKAQDFKRRSFSDLDRDKDGYVDAKVRQQPGPCSISNIEYSSSKAMQSAVRVYPNCTPALFTASTGGLFGHC